MKKIVVTVFAVIGLLATMSMFGAWSNQSFWDTTYAFTLTVDDILIKQNHFLVDGAPMVSYEYFRRAGG